VVTSCHAAVEEPVRLLAVSFFEGRGVALSGAVPTGVGRVEPTVAPDITTAEEQQRVQREEQRRGETNPRRKRRNTKETHDAPPRPKRLFV